MGLGRASLAFGLSVVCAVALTFVLGARSSAGTEDSLEPTFSIDWALTPSDVDELTANSQIVVEVYATTVADGEPITIDEPSELPSIPTRLTQMHVTDVLAGEAPETLTVLQVGSSTAEVPDDPPYELGRRYVLFLEPAFAAPHQDGAAAPQYWVITAPDGRLQQGAGGALVPQVNGPVANELKGVDITEMADVIDPSLVEEPSTESPVQPSTDPTADTEESP